MASSSSPSTSCQKGHLHGAPLPASGKLFSTTGGSPTPALERRRPTSGSDGGVSRAGRPVGNSNWETGATATATRREEERLLRVVMRTGCPPLHDRLLAGWSCDANELLLPQLDPTAACGEGRNLPNGWAWRVAASRLTRDARYTRFCF